MIGKILAEYRILEELGGQAGSRVYKAMGFNSRRQVAIKIFPSDLSRDKARLQALLESLRRISRVDRPGIPRLIGSGLNAGRAYIIMPFMTGGSLQDRLEIGRISPDDALDLLETIAGALEAIHTLDTVHGHLSPSEVMFDETGQPQIIGLGHAPFVPNRWNATSNAAGEEYIAPEVLNGAPPTAASDQYSLAVLAYELLTGERAREAIEAPAPAKSNGKGSTARRAELSPAVAEVFRRALQDDPSTRYRSVSEMVRALDKASHQKDTTNPAPQPARAGVHGTQRVGRSLGWGIASLAVVALGCFVLTLPAVAAAAWMGLDLNSIADVLSPRPTAPPPGVSLDRSWISLPELPVATPTLSSSGMPNSPVPTSIHNSGHVADSSGVMSSADDEADRPPPPESSPDDSATTDPESDGSPRTGSASDQGQATATPTELASPTPESNGSHRSFPTPVPSLPAGEPGGCSDPAGRGCTPTPATR